MQPVRYHVVADPAAHRFRVRGVLRAPAANPVFRLPSWIRGSYRVRDFAKHVMDLRARVEGAPAAIERLDKRSFGLRARAGERIELEYQVHALDPSVRKAYLDTRRGFFNGSSLFYCPQGAEGAPFAVEIARPAHLACARWQLATAMTPQAVDAEGFGVYRAADYEELIDHPVEMAEFRRVAFEVDGIPHAFVLSGRCAPDEARLAADAARLCAAQRALFDHEPELERYLFLTQVTGNGYGGLEHRASSALVAARDALPRPGETRLRKGYRDFLGLVSHEYFHLWNVKRIAPRAFLESDLGAEAYSRDLWAYEGVTSYYDDLMLLRAGLLDAPAYLDLLAIQATRLQRTPGRRVQTLAEASFEAWIKFYQPDDNTPNAAVSYYVKGALVAVCLDLHLRRHSSVNLDEVLRALWRRYGRQGTPAPEGALEAVAAEVSGLDLRPQFDAWLRSTEELPLAELLAEFGVQAERRAARGAEDEGGRVEPRNGAPVWLGLRLRSGEATIAQVLEDSPAQRAGLAAGDALVALDGLRVSAATWDQRLETLAPGREVELHFFRGDELHRVRLVAEAPPQDTWTFTLAKVDGERLARRRAWLGV
ncbi:MAG: M61 family metallopeptidase [Nevskia sp.]|nr:M61 family metallopeptidase [Nevskia sp.]